MLSGAKAEIGGSDKLCQLGLGNSKRCLVTWSDDQLRAIQLLDLRCFERAEAAALQWSGNPAVSFRIELDALRDFDRLYTFTIEDDLFHLAEACVAQLSLQLCALREQFTPLPA